MSWYEELDKWAADYLPEMEYEKDAPLDRYTSFRIGGPARRMAFPRSGEAAVLLVSHALELGARPFVLGNGTNVLFPDEGVERLVICTRDMAGVAAGAVAVRSRQSAAHHWQRSLFSRRRQGFPGWSSPTGYREAWAAQCA